MIIVSACLAGRCTRYDGSACTDDEIVRMVERGEAIALCPEELGRLGTPRPPVEIHGGDGMDVLDGRATVVDQNGRDATREFMHGAHEVLRIAQMNNVRQAILKDKSPSCGVVLIYKNNVLVPGMGVTAALLARHGIRIKKRS